jgi:hypothetical protein
MDQITACPKGSLRRFSGSANGTIYSCVASRKPAEGPISSGHLFGQSAFQRRDSASMAPRIAESGSTRWIAPSRIASFGIPKTMLLASS